MSALIVEEGPSYRIERDQLGRTLVVTDAWHDGLNYVLASGRVDGLDLNYAKGFKDSDLAFMREWPVKRLSILARTVKDLSPVLRLAPKLEALSVQTAPSATIALERFPVLSALAAEWPQIRSSIAGAQSLREVMVRAYDGSDLTPFRWNTELRRLRFKDRPRIRHLEGIAALRSLDHLAVYVSPLEDLDALLTKEVSLRELHVESSSRIRDLAPLSAQLGLRLVNASECGELASLGPLRGCSSLETLWLYGTTRVKDDDLSPLMGLPKLRELRMRSRRSYRPSVEDVQAHCAERT